MPPLPPRERLRCFAAPARHQSVVGTANELQVTAAADRVTSLDAHIDYLARRPASPNDPACRRRARWAIA